MLTGADLQELRNRFPELDWLANEGWQDVASFADWDRWLDEEAARCTIGEPDYSRRVQIVVKLKRNRTKIRQDCRDFYGERNVPNINDPEDPEWA